MSEKLLLDKLEDIFDRCKEVETMIADPAIMQDMKKYVKLNKEYKELKKITDVAGKYKTNITTIEESKEILNTEDDEEHWMGIFLMIRLN